MPEGLSTKKKTLICILIILALGGLVALWLILRENEDTDSAAITDFNSCVAAGNPVMESYPRQCAAGGQTFTEDLDSAEEQTDISATTYQSSKGVAVVITNPTLNEVITSPLMISGEVPGSWSFEGSFPIVLIDADNNIIAQATATLGGDWTTDELVPFTAILTFTTPEGVDSGGIVLQRDNPSGLAENDDTVGVTVQF